MARSPLLPWRPGRRLAARAEVRRSACQPDLHDALPAAPARLARPAVGAKLVLVAPAQLRAANVIADGRAAAVDGPAQDGDDGLAQPLGLGGVKGLGRPGRMEPGLEQGLVGVNVADARDDV